MFLKLPHKLSRVLPGIKVVNKIYYKKKTMSVNKYYDILHALEYLFLVHREFSYHF